MHNYDAFYSALEQGRIEPITFWKYEVSKWTWEEQLKFEIELIALCHKEEIEGRYGSNLHRYAQNLEKYLSQQSNIQRQMERKQQAPSTDAEDNKQRDIPIELQSTDAQRLLSWLVEGGFLTESLFPTDKLKPKRKLAYLCFKMSEALNLGKNNRGGNRKDNCWKPFEILFNTTGLGNNFNQLLRDYNYDVKGLYSDIDAIFD